MTNYQLWLTVGTLAGTAVVLLAIGALVWKHPASEKDGMILGVPAGELLVSLATLGVLAALLFSGLIDRQIAGTLLGAHIGYHAAAAGGNRLRASKPSDRPQVP
ncbi:hypothetical protein EB73_09840 [Mycobacterium sp. SWH-M3]|nr:hypothetical protein EB73_09840 [Mycobacterium sp. SWH-M3]